MAQVITTKYVGPTDKRGSRVVVNSWRGRKTYGWDNALSSDENHAVAAGHFVAMINKGYAEVSSLVEWAIVGGGSMPDGKGYGFVIDLVKK